MYRRKSYLRISFLTDMCQKYTEWGAPNLKPQFPNSQLSRQKSIKTFLTHLSRLIQSAVRARRPMCSVMSDSLPPLRLEPTRLLCPWDSSDKNAGVDCHFLFQRIFLARVLTLRLLHRRQILHPWATWEAWSNRSPPWVVWPQSESYNLLSSCHS